MYRYFVTVVALALFAVLSARAEEPTQQKCVRDLLHTLKTGTKAEQEKASHGVSQEIDYRGIGTLPAKDVVADLTPFVNSKNAYIRKYVVQALAAVGHECAVAVLIQAIDDPNLEIRGEALGGLARLGPKAKDAIPVLTAKIKGGAFHGFRTLVAIAGKDSVPVILEATESGKLTQEEQYDAATALSGFADPRAAAFMGKLFDERTAKNVPLDPVRYFAKLGGEASLARLRKCLDYHPTDPDGELSSVAQVREIAVETIGKNKDKESFDAILKLAVDDPSIFVQTAAAAGLGEYADKRGIPVLVKLLGQKNKERRTDYHNTFIETAVESLGKIGADDALTALFAGAMEGPAQRQCVNFWIYTENPKHFDMFLKLNEAKPLDKQHVVSIMRGQIRLLEPKELTAEQRAAAEAEFVKTVAAPTRFGQDADLTEKGKYFPQTTIMIYEPDFVMAAITYRGKTPSGHRVQSVHVLYRKTAGQWRPVGQPVEFVIR